MSGNTRQKSTERGVSLCPCRSGLSYGDCCMPFHHGEAKPATAERLMRSRYSAYFFRRVDYLVDTTHPDTKEPKLREDLEKMIHEVNWSNLTIVESSGGCKEDKSGKVEFVADYFLNGEPNQLHERSRFRRFKGDWKYLDGKR